MENTNIETRCRNEARELHRFFQQWFNGELPDNPGKLNGRPQGHADERRNGRAGGRSAVRCYRHIELATRRLLVAEDVGKLQNARGGCVHRIGTQKGPTCEAATVHPPGAFHDQGRRRARIQVRGEIDVAASS